MTETPRRRAARRQQQQQDISNFVGTAMRGDRLTCVWMLISTDEPVPPAEDPRWTTWHGTVLAASQPESPQIIVQWDTEVGADIFPPPPQEEGWLFWMDAARSVRSPRAPQLIRQRAPDNAGPPAPPLMPHVPDVAPPQPFPPLPTSGLPPPEFLADPLSAFSKAVSDGIAKGIRGSHSETDSDSDDRNRRKAFRRVCADVWTPRGEPTPVLKALYPMSFAERITCNPPAAQPSAVAQEYLMAATQLKLGWPHRLSTIGTAAFDAAANAVASWLSGLRPSIPLDTNSALAGIHACTALALQLAVAKGGEDGLYAFQSKVAAFRDEFDFVKALDAVKPKPQPSITSDDRFLSRGAASARGRGAAPRGRR